MDDKVNFSGKWHNQHNSDMTLKVSADGRITGKYRTGVGAPTPAEEFPLVGFVAGDLISFTVNFGKYGSLTSWAGQHTKHKATQTEEIVTQWYLAKNVPDKQEPKKLWACILSGCDTFRRGPHPADEMTSQPAPSHPISALL